MKMMREKGKQMRMKRFLAILLSFVIAFTMIPTMTGVAFGEKSYVCKIGDVGYDTFGDALDAASQGNCTITLYQNISPYKDVWIPENTTIVLNGYSIDKNGRNFYVISNLILEIANETDLKNANKISSFYVGKTYTWRLTDSFEIKDQISNGENSTENSHIILDGNNHTITASNSNITGAKNYNDYAFYFNRDKKAYDKIEIKDLTLIVGNGFRSGFQFLKVNGEGKSASLSNVEIKMERTVAPIKTAKPSEIKYGAAIVNNNSRITVNDKLKITTDEYSWAAIDLDKSKGNASLIFATGSDVSFVDNREVTQKEKEPLVGLSVDPATDSNWIVTGFENVGLAYAEQEKLTSILTNRCKDGYDLATARVERTERLFVTLKEALDSAASGDTVSLIGDTILTGSVGVADNVTIKLNGFDVTKKDEYSFHSGAGFTFEISCEDDLKTAAKLSVQDKMRNFIWKLAGDITVNETINVYSNLPQITIDGNNHKITATSGTNNQNHILYFSNPTSKERSVVIKDLKLYVNDGFRSGICFDRKSGKETINAELDGVAIAANRQQPPYNIGTLIQNNSCNITVKNNLELVTDEYCWSAIDLDNSTGGAFLVFTNEGDSNVSASFTDGRSDIEKANEPYIGMSASGSTVSNAEYVGLIEVTAYGKDSKYGYNLPEKAQETSLYFPDPYVQALDGTLMKESEVYEYNAKLHAEEVAKIQSEAKDWKVTVRTTLAKKGIKIYAYLNGFDTEELFSYLDKGYTVQYDWYKANGKNKKYKFVNTTDDNYLYDKDVKSQKTYYFKCKVTIFDQDGKIVRTKFTDCKYGCRKVK